MVGGVAMPWAGRSTFELTGSARFFAQIRWHDGLGVTLELEFGVTEDNLVEIGKEREQVK